MMKGGKYLYFGERQEQLAFIQKVLDIDGSHLANEILAVKYSTAYILYDTHINVNKRRAKTFKKYHDDALFK